MPPNNSAKFNDDMVVIGIGKYVCSIPEGRIRSFFIAAITAIYKVSAETKHGGGLQLENHRLIKICLLYFYLKMQKNRTCDLLLVDEYANYITHMGINISRKDLRSAKNIANLCYCDDVFFNRLLPIRDKGLEEAIKIKYEEHILPAITANDEGDKVLYLCCSG